MRVIVDCHGREKSEIPNHGEKAWLPENTIEIERRNMLHITETICNQCRHPYLALRLFIHVMCGIETDGNVHINARHLSKKLGVHYDTVSKSMKFLREIGVMWSER